MLSIQLSMEELLENLSVVGQSPKDHGTLEMIVCRPNNGERQILEQAEINLKQGLVGDNWVMRGSRHTEDGSAHPELQITIMNSRIIQLLAQDRSNWSLAGDQLFIDFDLSAENLAAGQKLAIGSVILEITPFPHTGCKKFTERFGSGATRFVNSPEGRQNRRRGINARVIQSGAIRVGDTVTKLD